MSSISKILVSPRLIRQEDRRNILDKGQIVFTDVLPDDRHVFWQSQHQSWHDFSVEDVLPEGMIDESHVGQL